MYSSWCAGTDQKVRSTDRGSRCGSAGQEQNCWYACGRIAEMASRNSDRMSLKVKEFEAESIIFVKIVDYQFSQNCTLSVSASGYLGGGDWKTAICEKGLG